MTFKPIVATCLVTLLFGCSADTDSPESGGSSKDDNTQTKAAMLMANQELANGFGIKKPKQRNLPVISSSLPTQPNFGNDSTLEEIQHDFDVFSWNSFFALNWPAAVSGNPGTPNTSVTIGDDPTAMRVWQQYKESRDIFLPNGEKPLGWRVPNPPPTVCKQGSQSPTLANVGKTPNVLDESGEPFQTGPLIDQNGQYTRFEILTNEVMFNYIVNNELYSQAGQSKFGGDADFTFSTKDKVGSIMLKAAWKVIGNNDDPSKFYVTDAYLYDNPHEQAGVKEACHLAKVGLVGFHIGTKVDGNPQWIWSTFEHVDNVPTQNQKAAKTHYNYFNPECDDCVVNTPPPRPWNPATPHTTPGQIERVIAIDDATKALNKYAQGLLKKANPKSVWVNYELVSTQWPTDPGSKTDPTGIPAPMFLANTTLETYIQGSIRQTSSSCIQCHNNATMTTGKFSDFTYLLQRAQ